jgi:serralysin
MFGAFTGTTATIATGNNNIDGLITADRWTSTTVTYSFTDNFANDYEAGYSNASVHSRSFQTLNATHKAVMRKWAKAYHDVSLLNLVEQTGVADRDATLRIAVSDDADTAYGYNPEDTVQGGDIWFNPRDYNAPVIGDYAYYIFGHELGHALGLKHPHETSGVRNVTMNADRDSHEFSVMSYRSYIGASISGSVTNEIDGFAQSLMMYDISAIQQEYGANFSSNAGNTTYTFSLTTGEMFIDGVGQGTPGDNRVFRTIWDGNGTDTYNFSNYSTNLAIDLTPGGWSDLDVGGNFQRANLDEDSAAQYARGHVFNALQYRGDARSLIENANGGSGNDRITGNSANNTIRSGAGNDTVDGGAGNDIIDLGAGNDTGNGGVGNDIINGGIGIDRMTGGTGNDIYYIDNVGDLVIETSTIATEIDTVYSSISNTLVLNVERLTLTGTGAINGSGNSLNNIITGNGAANTLYGGAGSDTLSGGLGADKFWFKSKTDGVDSIDFKSLEGDKILISASGFGGGLVAGQAITASQLLVSGGSVATNTSQRLIYNSATGGLFFDLDGSGAGASVQFATLSTRPTTLATSSFVIA